MWRKMLKELEVGEKAYRVNRQGFIKEYHKVSEDTITTRTLNPTRKGLPPIVEIPPPKPFKDWESYRKWMEEKPRDGGG